MNHPIQLGKFSDAFLASAAVHPALCYASQSHPPQACRPINSAKINREPELIEPPVSHSKQTAGLQINRQLFRCRDFPFSIFTFLFSKPNSNTAANRNLRNSFIQKEKTFSNSNKNGCFSAARFSASRSALSSENPFPRGNKPHVPVPTGVPSNPTASVFEGGPSCVFAVSFP